VKAQKAYDSTAEEFEGLGGYQIEQRARRVLTGLSFRSEDFQRPCSELSGGWQMRVALARALLSEPALLLLDEPTNHMDVNAKRWLATYLADGLSADTTMLLVTHDRALLEEIRCSVVFEIAAKRIMQYNCSGIKQWEQIRTKRTAALRKEIAKLEKVAELDRDFIQRWGAKASHATLAQSRSKKLAKVEMKLQELNMEVRGLPRDVGKAEAPTPAGTLPLASPSRVRLNLPDAPLAKSPPVDGVLLGMVNAHVGYVEGAPIIRGVSLSCGRGARIALLGPNGCGKSTLLRALAGTMEVQAGRRKVGAGSLRRARVALFTQDLAQDLPADKSPVEYVLGDGAPIMLDVEGARKALGALGLRNEVHQSQIGTLSGGEKARVALAVFATRPADVLLLDEPTNHLDGAAVAALSNGLREHGGAVIVASHDKAFIDDLDVTSTITVIKGELGQPGTIQVTEGLPTSTVVRAAPAEASSCATDSSEPALRQGQGGHEAQRVRRESRKLMSKIERLEKALEEAEEKMNAAYSEETFSAYEKLKARLDELYQQWEDLEEQALAVA